MSIRMLFSASEGKAEQRKRTGKCRRGDAGAARGRLMAGRAPMRTGLRCASEIFVKPLGEEKPRSEGKSLVLLHGALL